MKINVQLEENTNRILVVYKVAVEGISTEIDITEEQYSNLLNDLGNYFWINNNLIYNETYINQRKLENNLLDFRRFRDQQFIGFDRWERAVLRNRELDNEDVMNWYQVMIDFPMFITKDTTESDYPITPDQIKKYI